MLVLQRKGDDYIEHVIPLSYLTKLSMKLYGENKSVQEVAKVCFDLYLVDKISKQEAQVLNKISGFKTGIPEGWKLGDDPLARLKAANIVLKKPDTAQAA